MSAATAGPAGRPLARRLSRHGAAALGYVVVFVAAWEAYVRLADVPAFLLPRPESVWHATVQAEASGLLWPNFFYTLRNIVLGFAAGVLIGCVLGYALWSSRTFRELCAPYITLLQAAPKIALAPLLVLWFGLGAASQLALILLLSFFPIMVSMQLGLNSVTSDQVDLGRVLGMPRRRFFWTIQLPSCLPSLFSGAKISIIDAMTGAFLAEYITARKGLGYLMVLGNSTFDSALLISAVLLTVMTGLLGFGIVTVAERALVKR